jgi:hypothetical protein
VKRSSLLRQFANALIGLWLIVVLCDLVGLFALPWWAADIASLTVVVVLAGMIWKYALHPMIMARHGDS